MKKSKQMDKLFILFTVLFVLVGIILIIYTFFLTDNSYVVKADLIYNENYRIIVSTDGKVLKGNTRYVIDNKIYINQEYIKDLTDEIVVNYAEYEDLGLKRVTPLACYFIILLGAIIVGNLALSGEIKKEKLEE